MLKRAATTRPSRPANLLASRIHDTMQRSLARTRFFMSDHSWYMPYTPVGSIDLRVATCRSWMGSGRKQSLRWPKQFASSAVLTSRRVVADDLPIAAPSKVYSSLADEKKVSRSGGSGRGVDLGRLWSEVSQNFKSLASPAPGSTSVPTELMPPLPPPVTKNGSPSFPSIKGDDAVSSFCFARSSRVGRAINSTVCGRI